MSKSLGNMTFVSDLLDRYPAATIRRLLLARHYRDEWEFDEKELRQLQDWIDDGMPTGEQGVDTSLDRFIAALDDDLHVDRALAVLDAAAVAHEPWVDQGRELLGLN
jgi:cysteinyl-tRNA synthetase